MKSPSIANFLLFAFLATFCCAEDENKEQYLLLNNGQVVAGKITQQDGKYWVTKKSGSRIAFLKNKVDSISDSQQGIYWQKYAQLPASDVQGHIGLTQWCLERKLLEQAANQIDVLQLLGASPSTLLQLNEKLIAMMDQKMKRQDSTSSLVETANETAKDDPSLSPTVSRDDQVRPVNFESDLVERERLAIERAKYNRLLETTTKNLPDHSVVMFKRKIEPLLIHSCYTAKCHDGGNESLNFRTLSKNSPIPKRMSQENLLQILKMTNFDKPMDSKLLLASGLPHAGNDKPIMKLDSLQFQLLRTWLISISASPYHFHPLPSDFLESDSKVTIKSDKDLETAEISEPTKATETESFAPIPTTQTPPNGPHKQQRLNAKDPFDPEIFNKKYRKKDK